MGRRAGRIPGKPRAARPNNRSVRPPIRMNAPDRLAISSVLGALSMSYSPLIDRARRAFGTRLTMLSLKPQDRLPVGLMLDQLGMLWPEATAPVLVAPLDAELDGSLLDWE